MNTRLILCNSCQHNIKNTSCGACADKAINTMKGIDLAVQKKTELEDAKYTIYSCKVGINDPAVLQELDPYDCKFYFSNAFKVRL